MLLWKFLLGILFNLRLIRGESLNTREYFRMPKLYLFDDFEECTGLYQAEAFYCVVNTYVKPDAESELYRFIRSFSANTKQHFRHDKLQRGICMNKCWETLQKLGNDSTKYYVEQFPTDSKLIYEFVEYFNAKEHRRMYDGDVNRCINVELQNEFDLSGFSSIEYCIKEGMRPPLDWLDLVTAAIFLTIFVLVFASSLFDRYLRNTINSESASHFKTTPHLKSHRILTLFSVRRNWNILSAPAKPEVRDLRFIQAVRTLTMFLVIVGHCCWYTVILPSYNSIYVEHIYSNLLWMLLVNGIQIVQSFFVIGGFLTGYMFLKHIETDKSPGWLLLFKAVFLRYLRLVPLLVLTILMHSTWLYRAGSGPAWDRVNFSERQFCRQHWWINMLFLDNYLEIEMKCLIHSWYLAVDFWLSTLAILVLIVIRKKPELKYWLVSFVLAAAAFITGFVTYINKFEPITIFAPENLRNQYFIANETDPNYFRDVYSPTHMNIGNYFIGVLVGIIYYDLKAQNKNVSKILLLRIIWYLSVVAGFATVLSAYIFYTYDFEKPAIWISLLAILLKHSWGMIIGFGIIGVTYRYGWFLANVTNYPGWRIIGRISYGTFICHLFILKMSLPGLYQPINLSVFNQTSFICAVFALSTVTGLLLTLMIEMPIGSLFKTLFTRRKREENNNEIPMSGSSS